MPFFCKSFSCDFKFLLFSLYSNSFCDLILFLREKDISLSKDFSEYTKQRVSSFLFVFFRLVEKRISYYEILTLLLDVRAQRVTLRISGLKRFE